MYNIKIDREKSKEISSKIITDEVILTDKQCQHIIARHKNSIITCIPIGENRLKSYINNGKIIYKNE